MRMDPGYYRLYAALRPDGNSWLISYPYYTKLTPIGSSTAFRHMDVHPEKLVNDISTSSIQGSVSLTNEDEHNCTIIVERMHNYISEWLDDMKKVSGLLKDAPVINITDEHFTDTMAERYSTGWVRYPCTAGTVRISMPHLPHGSTGPATAVRRTILPWFMGVLSDHESLDHPGGTWSELSIAHTNKTPARLTPSGKPNNYGTVSAAFPAAVHLRTSSPLANALVGRVRWDDSEVQEEMAKVLSTNKTVADGTIRNIRLSLKLAFTDAWEQLVRLEKRLYPGNKSYFRCVEQDLEAAPADDEDPAEFERLADYYATTDLGPEPEDGTSRARSKEKGKVVTSAADRVARLGGEIDDKQDPAATADFDDVELSIDGEEGVSENDLPDIRRQKKEAQRQAADSSRFRIAIASDVLITDATTSS